MRVHYLQHVDFEGLSCIESFLVDQGHTVQSSRLFEAPQLPEVESFDWLIVMGGPMGVHDEEAYPFLIEEKKLIKQSIDSGKIVLGICLGAQLIAQVLGAKVYPNTHKEIGWFPIKVTPEIKDTVFADVIPDRVEVFHWHGDTFELPTGATLLASSEVCQHQGFIVNERVVGLQFHLEATLDTASSLLRHCADDLEEAKYVQFPAQILADPQRFEVINQILYRFLAILAKAKPL